MEKSESFVQKEHETILKEWHRRLNMDGIKSEKETRMNDIKDVKINKISKYLENEFKEIVKKFKSDYGFRHFRILIQEVNKADTRTIEQLDFTKS